MSNFITIKLRRGTAAQWASTNPVLAEGEFGAETDTRKFKIGNGVTAWNSLQYWGGSGGGAADFTDLGDVPPSYTGQAGKYVKVNGTADGLEFGTLTIAAGDLPTGIDAAKIADGTVSNTEFQYLNGVSSAIQTQLDGKVDENAAITGATKTKITYDAKGLVTAGADATTADIADSTDKRYVTEAEKTKLANTSGTNTGDQTITLTGDVTGSGTGSFAATIANGAVTNAKVATGIDAAKLADGSVSNTEYQYLNGVTSAIQSQIDGKVSNAVVVSSNQTAVNDGVYHVVASATFTDPTPAEGKGYVVFVRNGTATVGGTGYSTAGNIIRRVYHSGAWANYLYTAGGGGSATWGAITGTLSSQTDLQTALDGKVDENAAIIGATKTKITYDAKGLVTAGTDATTADIADSTDKRYVTEAEKTKLANTSGTNTGDQTITLTGDVTGTGTGSFAATIANNAVTLAKIQDLTTARILGRVTAGTGDPEQLTGAQVTTLLNTFTSSLKGLAPASGGGTTNFLRADGTWAAPSGGGGGSGDVTTLAQSTTQTGPVNTTTETPIFSHTLPTDLAAGETLVLDITGEVLNNSGSGQTIDIYVKLGTTTAVFYSTTQGASGTKRSFHMRVIVFIVSTTSQKFSVVSQMAPGNTGTGGAITTSFAVGTFAGYGTAAENTTSAKTLQVTADLGAANANFYFYAEAATLTRIAAP